MGKVESLKRAKCRCDPDGSFRRFRVPMPNAKDEVGEGRVKTDDIVYSTAECLVVDVDVMGAIFVVKNVRALSKERSKCHVLPSFSSPVQLGDRILCPMSSIGIDELDGKVRTCRTERTPEGDHDLTAE